MFLHIAQDEKFINQARELFEAAAPGENVFLIYKDFPDLPCVHVELKPRMIVRACDAKQIATVVRSMEDLEGIVVHGLSQVAASAMNLMDNQVPKLWLAWGYDVYESAPSLRRKLYQSKTLQFIKKNLRRRIQWHLKLLAKSWLGRLGMYQNSAEINYFRAVQCFTFCAPVLPNETGTIRRHCGFKGRFLRFSYDSYGYDTAPLTPNVQDAKDILVGNSCTVTSNHVDAFKMLSKLNLGDKKVIVPLSYGSAGTAYRDYVVQAGNSFLGQRFVPITTYLPAREYFDLVGRCGVLIMNHHRQQAGGNIVTGLWNGARVFVPEQNPAYSFFRGLGATIMSVRRDLTKNRIERPLSENVAAKNRAVIQSEYGKDAVMERTRKLVEVLRMAKRV